MSKVTSYVEDVYKELQKVSWPKRKELQDNTILTLIASFLVSLIIFGADKVINQALKFILSLA